MKVNHGVKFYTVKDFISDLTNDFIYSDAILEAFCYENRKQMDSLIETVNVGGTFQIKNEYFSLKKLIECWIDMIIMTNDDEVDYFNEKKIKDNNRTLKRSFEIEFIWENISKICEIEYPEIILNNDYKMDQFIDILISKLKTVNNMLLFTVILNDN